MNLQKFEKCAKIVHFLMENYPDVSIDAGSDDYLKVYFPLK